MVKRLKKYERYSFSTKKEAEQHAKKVLMPLHKYKRGKKVMCIASYKIKKDVPSNAIIKKYKIKKIYPRYGIWIKETGKCS